jgi:hypothetical protein
MHGDAVALEGDVVWVGGGYVQLNKASAFPVVQLRKAFAPVKESRLFPRLRAGKEAPAGQSLINISV